MPAAGSPKKMGSIPELSVIRGEQRKIFKKKLHQEFEENLKASKIYDNTSIIFQENEHINKTSYRQLNEQANKLARGILKRIKDPPNNDGDHIVAVCMQPSDRLLIVLLSILKTGAAYLPLEPSFPEQRVKHILREAKPIMVIHDESVDMNYFINTQQVSFATLSKETAEENSENIMEKFCLKQATGNLALVLYTSGSTGIPKGVRLPHDAIQNRLQWQYITFPFSPTEKTCIFKTSLTFVDSICEIWAPLLNGITVLVVPKMTTKDPERLILMLTDHKIERLSLVPSLLRSMLLYLSLQPPEKKLLQSLQLWISSGEVLSASLVRDFFSYFGPEKQLCNFYGSTEIMADVTYSCITCPSELKNMDSAPIGNPIFNTIIYLLDNKLRPVPVGDIGELWVSGYNLAAGYVNGRSPESFINNPLVPSKEYSRLYHTGDFARISKGTLIYEGRTDSQIKIRGQRLDLMEVEKVVMTIEGVEKGIVLCYKNGKMDQTLLAFVTYKPGYSTSASVKIESLLKNKLPAYMIPRVIIVDSIPLLVNGKIDRQALLQMYENNNFNDHLILDVDYSGVPAFKLSAAEVLFRTIGSIIGRPTRIISISSNYYELGGNSLNSIYTITKLKEQGYEISVTDFISAENLGTILDKITSDSRLIINQKQMENYVVEPLEDKHKDIVYDMIITSFYEKSDLEILLKPNVTREHYHEMMEEIWSDLIEKALSFVLIRKCDGLTTGCCLNFDARDEPESNLENDLTAVFDFYDYLEIPIRDQCLPPGIGQILHSYLMATHPSLSAQGNISAVMAMEEELLSLAQRKGFAGIYATNTSPLTQQLCTILEYEVLCDYQANQYVTPNGEILFANAPDSLRVILAWKPIK